MLFTIGPKTNTHNQPIAIYMVEENHFGQVIHNAFTMMPINAKLQIANSNGVPYLGYRISKHTGV